MEFTVLILSLIIVAGFSITAFWTMGKKSHISFMAFAVAALICFFIGMSFIFMEENSNIITMEKETGLHIVQDYTVENPYGIIADWEKEIDRNLGSGTDFVVSNILPDSIIFKATTKPSLESSITKEYLKSGKMEWVRVSFDIKTDFSKVGPSDSKVWLNLLVLNMDDSLLQTCEIYNAQVIKGNKHGQKKVNCDLSAASMENEIKLQFHIPPQVGIKANKDGLGVITFTIENMIIGMTTVVTERITIHELTFMESNDRNRSVFSVLFIGIGMFYILYAILEGMTIFLQTFRMREK